MQVFRCCLAASPRIGHPSASTRPYAGSPVYARVRYSPKTRTGRYRSDRATDVTGQEKQHYVADPESTEARPGLQDNQSPLRTHSAMSGGDLSTIAALIVRHRQSVRRWNCRWP